VLYQADAEAIRTWGNRMTDEYSTRAGQMTAVRKFSIHAQAGGHPPLTEMEGTV
jgi:hypothetical protein